MVSVLHPLEKIRTAEHLSRQELAELSGVSAEKIRCIENGTSLYKTNDSVADKLAGALYRDRREIFRDEELSHLGRPAHTSKKIEKRHKPLPLMICPHCRLEVYASDRCYMCEGTLAVMV